MLQDNVKFEVVYKELVLWEIFLYCVLLDLITLMKILYDPFVFVSSIVVKFCC